MTAVRAAADPAVVALLEEFRRELTGYCYRMLGSPHEAQDAVQETLVRGWRGYERFEGRASLRGWLYRIATNVCLDELRAAGRRALPVDLTEPGKAASAVLSQRPEPAWIGPVPDARVLPGAADPARTAETRESVRLAFVAALQYLPPRQRVVLILREVLAWRASEVAELLDTSVPAVNSALQRARATLAASRTEAPASPPSAAFEGAPVPAADPEPLDADRRRLLDRYVRAFEAYDMAALTAVLHEDAALSMPPYELWLRGAQEMVAWLLGTGRDCRGSRLVPTAANGSPAFAQYRHDPEGSGYHAWALQVLDVAAGRITSVTSFLSVDRLFPVFGLPLRLDAPAGESGPEADGAQAMRSRTTGVAVPTASPSGAMS